MRCHLEWVILHNGRSRWSGSESWCLNIDGWFELLYVAQVENYLRLEGVGFCGYEGWRLPITDWRLELLVIIWLRLLLLVLHVSLVVVVLLLRLECTVGLGRCVVVATLLTALVLTFVHVSSLIILLGRSIIVLGLLLRNKGLLRLLGHSELECGVKLKISGGLELRSLSVKLWLEFLGSSVQ